MNLDGKARAAARVAAMIVPAAALYIGLAATAGAATPTDYTQKGTAQQPQNNPAGSSANPFGSTQPPQFHPISKLPVPIATQLANCTVQDVVKVKNSSGVSIKAEYGDKNGKQYSTSDVGMPAPESVSFNLNNCHNVGVLYFDGIYWKVVPGCFIGLMDTNVDFTITGTLVTKVVCGITGTTRAPDGSL